MAWVRVVSGKVVLVSLVQIDQDMTEVAADDPLLQSVFNHNYGVSALEVAKKDKVEAINHVFSGYMASFTTGYPIEEMLSWDQQEKEAVAYNADSNAPVPLLSRLSNQRGLGMPTLQLRIRKKSTAYKWGTGVLIGERQRCEDAVLEAATIEDVNAVAFTPPSTFLADVQAAADAVT